MLIINIVDFRTWLWRKYDQWRKGTNRGVTEFAAHLGVGQPTVTSWLNGDYGPGSKSIKKIAKVYPDVYEVFGARPVFSSDGLPPDLVRDIRSLLDEIRLAIESKGLEPESPEAVKISNEMLDRFVSRRKTKA